MLISRLAYRSNNTSSTHHDGGNAKLGGTKYKNKKMFCSQLKYKGTRGYLDPSFLWPSRQRRVRGSSKVIWGSE